MEFAMRVLIIGVLAVIVILIIIAAMTVWTGESTSFIEGFFETIKSLIP